MKKIFTLMLITALLAASCVMLSACGQGSDEGAQPTENEETATTENEETAATNENTQETTGQSGTAGEKDALVVYFSRTGEQYEVGVIEKGNTAIVADMIKETTGADSFEILPKEDNYPNTYDELTKVAKEEQNKNARPAIAGEVPDLSKCSTVFIGAPVWWGDWPMIMYTFFEENADALAGKTLIPFSTHGGSGLSGFDEKLASACPDSTVGEGLAISGKDA